MTDDLQHPSTGTDAEAGSRTSGFSAFAAGSTLPGVKQQRRRTAAGVLAGLAVLGAVGALAATTGGHSTASPAAPAGPVVGVKHPGATPPRLVFTDAVHGYALYTDCATQPEGDGCAARLQATADGGKTWSDVPLPSYAPVDSAAWASFAAHGSDVLLNYSGGIAVSSDSGKTWKQVSLQGATSTVRRTDFLLNSEMVVDPVAGSAATFRPPVQIETPGEAGGQLPDGTIWLEDKAGYGLSFTNGNVWNVFPGSDPNVATAPLLGPAGHYARISGPASTMTIGRSGDGGELPATTVLFSTNQGRSWSETDLSPAAVQVNAPCTVFLADGRLVGVAQDGSGLLSLAKGASSFVPLTGGPASTPMCLESNGSLIWGATFDHHLVTSTDGKSWTVQPLGSATAGTPTASPSPSHS